MTDKRFFGMFAGFAAIAILFNLAFFTALIVIAVLVLKHFHIL